MSLPEPIIHPEETESETFWSEDGNWWNADVVTGGTLDIRVYGREYLSNGSKPIRWVIDCAEEDLDTLEEMLKAQAGDDKTTPRSMSLARATETSQKGNGKAKGNGNGNGHAGKKKEHRDGAGALGGGEDPIKSIKGMGENRVSDLTSCTQGNEATCSVDLTTAYPRDPA
ncbi:MAG TPA: hypothetical protein VIG99_30455 [Myxococcaceae bacterium]